MGKKKKNGPERKRTPSRGKAKPPSDPAGGILNDLAQQGAGSLWEEMLRPVVERHRAWWDRQSTTEPLYILPLELITELASAKTGQSHPRKLKRSALISPEDAAAERAFTAACKNYDSGVVGALPVRTDSSVRWDPIPYEYFAERQPLADFLKDARGQFASDPHLSWLNEMGPVTTGGLPKADSKLESHQQKALGYIGYLMLDRRCEDFQKQLAQFHKTWQSLTQPPPLPLNATAGEAMPLSIPKAPGSAEGLERLPDDVAQFLVHLSDFMRKYELSQLVTWDLPVPTAGYTNVPVNVIRQMGGPSQRVTTTPRWAGNLPDPDTHEQTRRFAAEADHAPFKDAPAGIAGREGHPSSYARAFTLWLMERSVRARYGSTGLGAALQETFGPIWSKSTPEAASRYVRTIRHIYLWQFED